MLAASSYAKACLLTIIAAEQANAPHAIRSLSADLTPTECPIRAPTCRRPSSTRVMSMRGSRARTAMRLAMASRWLGDGGTTQGLSPGPRAAAASSVAPAGTSATATGSVVLRTCHHGVIIATLRGQHGRFETVGAFRTEKITCRAMSSEDVVLTMLGSLGVGVASRFARSLRETGASCALVMFVPLQHVRLSRFRPPRVLPPMMRRHATASDERARGGR